MSERLPTDTYVRAHLRRLSAEGVGTYVLRRGEPMGGLVILRLAMPGGVVRVLTQTRDMEGNLAWMRAGKGEDLDDAAADAYIERAVKRDPDLWVVEIETRDGSHPFEGRVI